MPRNISTRLSNTFSATTASGTPRRTTSPSITSPTITTRYRPGSPNAAPRKRQSIKGSSQHDRGEARSKPSGLDGGTHQALPLQRRRRRAYVQDDPAGSPRDDCAVAAPDDDRQE